MFSSPLVNPVNSSLVGMHRYGSTPYIQDIHNGISNPLFTYTGGQSLVRDENGILRATTAGYPAIEGGHYDEATGMWSRPTGSTYISIPTRKGVRQVQTDPEFLGQLIEPAMTNKCTCVKANPTAVTGITVAGGAAATVVNDLTALTAAGLHKICLPNAYNFSIPQNGTVTLPGAVANLNKHSISAELRLVSGTGIQMGLTGALANITLTDAYQRIKQENLTPLVATDLVTFTNLNADTAVVRMVLPQLEENPFCTSPIIGTDTAAAQTRQANVTSAPTAGVFPMVSATGAQDFAIFLRVVPGAPADANKKLFSTSIDGSNRFVIYFGASNILRLNHDDIVGYVYLSTTYTNANDDPFELIALKTAQGMAIRYRVHTGGVWGAWSAWQTVATEASKTPARVGTTYQFGAIANIDHYLANYPLTAIIKLPPKATLADYQTWIDEELTRRGLI